MSFIKMLNPTHNYADALANRLVQEALDHNSETIHITKITEKKTPDEILRGANFKIKLVTPTSFGTQIEFAKQYPKDEIEHVLKDFNYKIKGKSVFIID